MSVEDTSKIEVDLRRRYCQETIYIHAGDAATSGRKESDDTRSCSIQPTRYYAIDFLDDKFYGSRDRVLATAFLEHLADLWGVEALVAELMSFPYTLQVGTIWEAELMSFPLRPTGVRWTVMIC